jgi:hypothetical protein
MLFLSNFEGEISLKSDRKMQRGRNGRRRRKKNVSEKSGDVPVDCL